MSAATSVRWGVGCFHDGRGRRPWPISHEEMARDIGAAGAVVRALDLGAGQRVLVCSMLAEAGQHWPLVVGAMLAGAQLSCADAAGGEAARVAMFLRLLDYDAVLGVTPALLDGMVARDLDPAEVFAGVRVLGAHPGAWERLAAAGLAPQHFVLCGPALAIAREPGGPARLDTDEWQVEAVDGRVVVTSLRPRELRFSRTPTNVHGAVVDGAVVPRPEGER